MEQSQRKNVLLAASYQYNRIRRRCLMVYDTVAPLLRQTTRYEDKTIKAMSKFAFYYLAGKCCGFRLSTKHIHPIKSVYPF